MDEDGPAIDLQFSDTGNSSPLLIYATSFGNIVGWDLRQPFNQLKLKNNEKITPAFKLENDLRDFAFTKWLRLVNGPQRSKISSYSFQLEENSATKEAKLDRR